MTRIRLSTLLLLAAPLYTFGCSSEEPSGSGDDDGDDCGEDVGSECDDCEEGETGELVCEDGELTCSCESSSTGDDDADDDDEVPADDDDDAPIPPKKDATVTVPPRIDAGKDSGSTTTSKPDAGGDTAPDAGGDDVDPPPSGEGEAPVIPPIMGECPEFKSGSATISGLSGITLEVGAKKEGTGSLLFYWHGTGSTYRAEGARFITGKFREELLAQGGIIVGFQGTSRMGTDCSGTGTFYQSDFNIADLIVACAVKNHGIDPRRIYATGCSAGGLHSGCMATVRSNYIAAAVPNSGGIVVPQRFQSMKYIPAIMTMHGGASDVVIVTFSQTSKTLDDQFKKAGGFVVNCNHGGGHCSAPGPMYQAAWEFMKAHPYGTKPSPFASALPSSFPSTCKIH